MRILYLCHRVPYPPDKGDKIRAFHQLRGLAARHEIDLFTLADDARDVAPSSGLLQYCRRVKVAKLNPKLARLRSLPYLCTRQPLTLPYFYSEELRTEVRESLLKRSYDRIVVYCSAMGQYVDAVEDIPIITDFVDVDSKKWMQYSSFAKFPLSTIYRREGQCLQDYERRLCNKSTAVIVTTEREAQLVRQFAPDAHVRVVVNGVDGEYFRPRATPADGTPTVVFTGDMSYFPNQQAVVYFARTVLPKVRAFVEGARFVIIGRNPSRSVLQLQDMEGVEVTGFVPDVRPYLAKAAVSVAPFLISAGIQNKILEAMAFGLPVVATPRVGDSLSRDVASMLELADTAEEMAAKIIALLRDPQLAQRKGTEGRRRVTAAYDWDQSLEQVLRIVEEPQNATAAYAIT